VNAVPDLLICDVNNSHPMKDWDAYAAFSPVVIAKMTEGKTFVAPTFAKHREGARKNGMRAFGAYHFWSPGVDPILQARNAVKALGMLRDDPFEWLILDVETGTEFEAYDAFCEFADAKLGRVTWLYGGRQLKDHAPHRPRWVARFFDHTPRKSKQPGIGETLWQFSDRFAVPGVGNADCSVYRGSADELLAFLTGKPAKPAKPAEKGELMARLDAEDLAAIEGIVRKVLNEGTGKGQRTWAGTSKAVLNSVHGAHNDLAEVKAMLRELQELTGPDGKVLVERIADRLGK
jgi:hypothetical protein